MTLFKNLFQHFLGLHGQFMLTSFQKKANLIKKKEKLLKFISKGKKNTYFPTIQKLVL